MQPQLRPSSQNGFLASTSDNLFHPVPGGTTSRVFILPNVPLNPNPQYHMYNRRVNTPLRQIPTHSSSYNNPMFTIPPNRPNIIYNPSVDSGVPPPISPQVCSQPVHNHFQPYYPGYHPLQFPLNPLLPTPALPSPSHVLPTVSKTLPSVSHISILTSKLDFFTWDEGITSLICANGLIGHILDPSEPLDPNRPDRVSAMLPVLLVPPLPADLVALNCWWDDDNIVQHILVSRLGSIPRGLLPSPNIATRTALSIYKMLSQYYGTSSFADCNELQNSLNNTLCMTGRVHEYVSKWRAGILCLQSARFPFSVKVCISQFVWGLPLIAAFTSIRADLPHRVAGAGDQDLGAFLTLTEAVLELDTIFCNSSLVHNSHLSCTPLATQPSSTPVSSNPPASTAPDSTTRPTKQMCSNCKAHGLRFTGHTDSTCFQQGGGMEGRWEEYLNNKGRVHAMFVEYLEDALNSQEPISQDTQFSPPSSPATPSLPLLDGDVVMPPVANLCVPTFAPNTDMCFDLYTQCDFSLKKDSHLTFPAVDFNNSALVSLVSLFNALLDSGCTHHII